MTRNAAARVLRHVSLVRIAVLFISAGASLAIAMETTAAAQSAVANSGGSRVPLVLNADLVKKFLAVQVEMMKAGAPSAPPTKPTAFQPDEGAQFLANDQAAAKVFADAGLTPTDFVRVSEAILKTAYALDMLEHGLITSLPSDVSEANVKVLQSLPADVAPLYKTWRETALEPALKVLRESKR